MSCLFFMSRQYNTTVSVFTLYVFQCLDKLQCVCTQLLRICLFQWGMERHQIMNAAFHPKSAQYMLATMGSEL
jgi:hypothetical protein